MGQHARKHLGGFLALVIALVQCISVLAGTPSYPASLAVDEQGYVVGDAGQCLQACSRTVSPLVTAADEFGLRTRYHSTCYARCLGANAMALAAPSACNSSEPIGAYCGADLLGYATMAGAACEGVQVVHAGAGACSGLAPGAQACLCPAVYEPVCGAHNVTFGNACLASCANSTVLYAGQCLKRKAGCTCSAASAAGGKVCSIQNITFSSACEASCWGAEIWYSDSPAGRGCSSQGAPLCGCPPAVRECGSDGKSYASACSRRCAHVDVAPPAMCNPACRCSRTAAAEEVCGIDGITYSSPCFAACSRVPLAYSGACGAPAPTPAPAPSPNPDDDCNCPDNWDPVCGVDGKTYGNTCEASCFGKVAVASPGECSTAAKPQASPARSPAPKRPSAGPGPKKPTPSGGSSACECAVGYEPLCGANNVTYHNECFAECAKAKVVHKGQCKIACTDCPTVGGAVCSVTPPPANASAGAPKPPTTYDNPCLARCSGAPRWPSYPAACNATCDAKCAAGVSSANIVCCADGREYPTTCYGDCLGAGPCQPGPCGGEEAAKVIGICANGAPTARCFADPCLAPEPRCPGWPITAKCVPVYCGAWYRGQLLKDLCSAVYIDPTTGDILPKCTPRPKPSPSPAKKPSPGGKKPSPGGKKPSPSKAPSPAPAPKPAGSCSTEYRPVCVTATNTTYPNACAAKALGLEFTPGACGTCTPLATGAAGGSAGCSCPRLGEPCYLKGRCCSGLVCYEGPISRPDAVFGRCYNASGPLPIG